MICFGERRTKQNNESAKFNSAPFGRYSRGTERSQLLLRAGHSKSVLVRDSGGRRPEVFCMPRPVDETGLSICEDAHGES